MNFGKRENKPNTITTIVKSEDPKFQLLLGLAGFVIMLTLASYIVQSTELFSHMVVSDKTITLNAIIATSGWKTALIIVHLIGLMLGFGIAIFLDLYLLRYLFHTKITQEAIQTVEFGSKIVNVGLILLWISGLGFLWHYQVASPETLSNPKIWAKVTIVTLLSINGVAIHFVTLAKLKTKIGSSLLTNEPRLVRLGLLFSGAISAVSWTMAMFMGAIKQINNVVEASTLLTVYVSILTLAFILLIALSSFIEKRFSQNKTQQNTNNPQRHNTYTSANTVTNNGAPSATPGLLA